MDADNTESARLHREYCNKQKTLGVCIEVSNVLDSQLSDLETHLIKDKEAKASGDIQFSDSKNEEALLAIEFNELLVANDTVVEQKSNESLINFSTTDTEEDVEHNANKIIELTKTIENLEAEVRTLRNDGTICRLETDEQNAEIAGLTDKYSMLMDEIARFKSEISQVQAQKQALTHEQDQVHHELIEKELKQKSKTGVEYGNNGLEKFDAYVKNLRIRLAGAREQKRHLELQNVDLSQQLDKKCRNREMSEQSRATGATIALVGEVCDQISFISHFKPCIDAFYSAHSKLVGKLDKNFKKDLLSLVDLKAQSLEHIGDFCKLLVMIRNSICAVLSKIPTAYQSEIEQLNEAKHRLQKSGLQTEINARSILAADFGEWIRN